MYEIFNRILEMYYYHVYFLYPKNKHTFSEFGSKCSSSWEFLAKFKVICPQEKLSPA